MLSIAALLDRPNASAHAPAVRLIGAAPLAAMMAAARLERSLARGPEAGSARQR